MLAPRTFCLALVRALLLLFLFSLMSLSCYLDGNLSGGGSGRSCVILSEGRLRCWGSNSYGQLGYGHTRNIGDNETPASAGDVNVGAKVSQIAVGSSHSCALLESGSVRCWGYNGSGQLGYGHTDTIGDNETPASAGDVDLGPGIMVTQVAVGDAHSCALLSTKRVRCWGYNDSGRLGYGHTEDIGDDETPASAASGGDLDLGGDVSQIAVGAYHSCALLDSNDVRCWGDNGSGQLGYGSKNTVGGCIETPNTVGPVELGPGIIVTQDRSGKLPIAVRSLG